uniref:Uncharacterized protein n=1 Tax=Cacopsylla melanoneura TaxID=428564 RepID=A0A8D9F5T6_9HEMI
MYTYYIPFAPEQHDCERTASSRAHCKILPRWKALLHSMILEYVNIIFSSCSFHLFFFVLNGHLEKQFSTRDCVFQERRDHIYFHKISEDKLTNKSLEGNPSQRCAHCRLQPSVFQIKKKKKNTQPRLHRRSFRIKYPRTLYTVKCWLILK